MKPSPSRNPPPLETEAAPRTRSQAPKPTNPARRVYTLAGLHGPWESMARDLSADEVKKCRADPQRAAQNLVAGAQHLLHERERLEAMGVSVDAARLATTESLAFALVSVAIPPRTRTGSVRAQIRALLPHIQDVFADAARQVKKGRLDGEVVLPLLRIRTLVGRVQAARQVVAMYRAAAGVIAGRTNLDDDDLRRTQELADAVLPRLRVDRSMLDAADDPRAAAIDLRDRYWTLVVRHHAWMQRLAGQAWGDALRAHVPPLAARRGARRARPATPAPTPVTPT